MNRLILCSFTQRKIRSLVKSFSLLLSCLFFASQLSIAAEQPLDRIAAVVNNDVVMLSSVLARAKRLKTALPNSTDKALIKQALEQLVLIKVQTQYGKELGIIIDDVMLNRTIEGIAKQNKLSLGDFRIALQRQGIEYSAFREDIRARLIIDALKQRQSGQRANISEQAVNDLIFSQASIINQDAQYQLQEIFIPAPNGINVAQFNSARKQAETLRRQLLNQASFASKHYPTKDLGWQANKELPASYSRALSLMGIDEISPVVHDSQGFHILKLVAKRGGSQQLEQQVHTRHILIGNPSNAGQKKAISIRNKIIAGADFATLAKTNSADTGSAVNGGDLGWAKPTLYVPEFAAVVKTAALKAISQPIKTKFGWHIIQVLERKKIDASRTSMRASAKSILAKKKNKNGYETWLQGIRDDAFIEYRLKL